MTRPDRAVALLRVVVGAWFVKAVWTKLTIATGVIPYPTVSPRFIAFQPKRVAEFAAGNPIGWYKDFLETTVLPHAALFATLQTIGEVAVGLGLLFGIMTRLAALVGLFLTVNFSLATVWMGVFAQQGFHLMLVTSMVIFLVTGAGRVWGVDRWLSRVSVLRWLASLVLVVVTASEAHAELRIFVTNERSDDVTVIAADSGTVLKTIAVGKRPRGVVASADGKRVYVANSNSDALSVIDAAGLTVTATMPAGRDPARRHRAEPRRKAGLALARRVRRRSRPRQHAARRSRDDPRRAARLVDRAHARRQPSLRDGRTRRRRRGDRYGRRACDQSDPRRQAAVGHRDRRRPLTTRQGVDCTDSRKLKIRAMSSALRISFHGGIPLALRPSVIVS